ncbi:MAG TPA: thiol reductant ABC exporter subunit CydC, partial [Candidatus Eisenbacteria bacterium]|nr:thiol reductant ABC exporter subunit CydC [Candidatus Eisenbacteria bacterium]
MNGRGGLGRLLRLVAPARGGMAVGALLSFATIAAGIGLMATAAYAIARAALVTSYVEIEAALAGVRAFAMSRGGLRYLERYTAHDVSLRLLVRLRCWFYAAIEPLAPAVLWRRPGGDLLSRIVADIETLEQFAVRVLIPAAAAIMAAIAAAALLALFDPVLGLAVVAAVAAIGLAVPLAAHRAGRTAARTQVAVRADLAGTIVDAVQGLPDLVAMGREPALLARVDRIGGRLERAERRLALVRGLSAAAGALLAALTVAVVLLVAIPQVAEGRLDGVYLAMLPLTALAALEAALPLPAAIDHLERSLAAAGRLFELTDARPAVREPAVSAPPPAAATIEIRDLCFGFEAGDALVLSGLDLSLAAGERVVIAGPSGAGKTTLVNLLLRFWEPTSGAIRIGGRDVHDWRSDDVRALFSVVAQDTHLFAGTVRANLLLARPGASEEEIADACRRARLHEVIERLPQAYDTWIGENGLLLSGGERQRLAIARAILKDAPILVLDEPTAHLDALTEADVLA